MTVEQTGQFKKNQSKICVEMAPFHIFADPFIIGKGESERVRKRRESNDGN